MKIDIINKKITDFKGDMIIVNLFEGVRRPGGATGSVDKALNGMVTELIKKGEISGKLGEISIIHTFKKIKADKVLIVGLGKPNDFDIEQIRKAAALAIKHADKARAKKIATVVHGAGIGGIEPDQAAQALIEGTLLALYGFCQYKKSAKKHITHFSVAEIDRKKIARLKKGIQYGRILAQGQNIARDFINEPGNNLTPEKLVTKLKKTIRNLGLTKIVPVRVLKEKDIRILKMNALLSVGRGSDNKPAFIVLRYKKSRRPLICLIGKTVTFDSGGISLKPSSGMSRMKGDMAGGAAVIGAFLSLVRTRAKTNIMAIIPAVENMPSGTASRPGDIVRARNGKSIEIISTDAEGRMTLADAICYAESKEARTIIDIATLTGGCVAALGDVAAAVMGNDQRLIDLLLSTTGKTGEKMWQLPMFSEYNDQIESDVADVKNSGGRKATSITAGLFLKKFVNKARWLHIDMAGKEISDKSKFYTPKGGTGYGTRTLVELVQEIK
jgi:leucyl aminopeptidase